MIKNAQVEVGLQQKYQEYLNSTLPCVGCVYCTWGKPQCKQAPEVQVLSFEEWREQRRLGKK